MKRWILKSALALVATSILGLASAQAGFELPPVITDHMVLQRSKPIVLWGWDAPGQQVNVTLAGSNAKARPPGANDTRGLSDARQLWFRHERQVTLPLGAGACLFLIRVLLAPYTSVVRTPEDHRRLVSSLASMSEDTIAYKQLAHARQLVMGSA